MSIIQTFDYYYFSFFLLVSYGVFNLYTPVKIALDNNDKFKKYDLAKRYYIIKNFIKSALMAIIFIAMAFVFIPNILRGEWNDSHNRLIGVFYVSNDLAGLFGGGGHYFAAGCKIEKNNVQDSIKKILKECNRKINNGN